MADFEEIAETFRYDLWANRLWLACLAEKGFPEPDSKVLGHILSAQKVWVRRLHGESLTAMPQVEVTEEAMVALNSEWLETLYGLRHDPVIDYRRTTGEPLSSRVSQIAIHVTNHGTYHRGELRGLCRARNDENFPETDRGRYWFQTAEPPR